MQKIYSRINWENFPSEKTAVNESNLNKMDLAIDNLDDRVVAMDASKVDLTKANELVKEILWDESKGTLTVVKMNGSRAVIDTKLEKLAVNFKYNPQTQQLVITLDDGTTQNVDLSSLITEYEFLDSDTIAFEIAGGKVKAIVKNGSITENHLAPEYLAEIRTQVGRAEMSAKSADASEKNAVSSSALAKSYAVGGTGTRDGEDTDNARYYMEQAKAVSAVDIATTEKAGIVKPDGTTITADEDGTLHGVAKITVDTALSPTSTNPVQNKVVKAYVDKKVSENVDFSTSTSKTLNDTVEAPLMLGNATKNLLPYPYATASGIVSHGVTITYTKEGVISLDGTIDTEQPGFLLYAHAEELFNNSINTLYSKYDTTIKGSLHTFFQIFKKDNSWVTNVETISKNDYDWTNYYCNYAIQYHKTSGDVHGTVSNIRIVTNADDPFVPYSGYDVKTIGKNLLNPTLQTTTQNGVTCTNNGDGTYTLNGTATGTSEVIFSFLSDAQGKSFYKNTVGKTIKFLNGGLINPPVGRFICTIRDGNNWWSKGEQLNNSIFTVSEGYSQVVVDLHIYKGQTVTDLTVKPMLTTNLNATYDDFVPYQDGGTVHIDSSTEFPLLGLKSFNGTTNIISPGNVKVTYAKSESGAAILDASENKLDKDNVVNNQTTTVEGFALDARQANPNIDGTLAKQISDLNGSLKYNLISNVTTDYNGVFTTNITSGEFIVLCAWCNLVNAIVIPYYNNGINLCFCVVDANGFNPYKNIENITIAYVYKKF